jgi:hypothetical protein
MSDPVPTRQETVEANIAAVISKFGDENDVKIDTQCLKDISISLAMLVDAGTTEG